jgi:hypothetical protein
MSIKTSPPTAPPTADPILNFRLIGGGELVKVCEEDEEVDVPGLGAVDAVLAESVRALR